MIYFIYYSTQMVLVVPLDSDFLCCTNRPSLCISHSSGVLWDSIFGSILFFFTCCHLDRLSPKQNRIPLVRRWHSVIHSCDPECPLALDSLHSCIQNVKNWLSQNVLHLNKHKTQSNIFNLDFLHIALSFSLSTPKFSIAVENFGVTFDSAIKFSKQFIVVVKVSFFQLRLLAKVTWRRSYMPSLAPEWTITTPCMPALISLPSVSFSIYRTLLVFFPTLRNTHTLLWSSKLCTGCWSSSGSILRSYICFKCHQWPSIPYRTSNSLPSCQDSKIYSPSTSGFFHVTLEEVGGLSIFCPNSKAFNLFNLWSTADLSLQ